MREEAGAAEEEAGRREGKTLFRERRARCRLTLYKNKKSHSEEKTEAET